VRNTLNIVQPGEDSRLGEREAQYARTAAKLQMMDTEAGRQPHAVLKDQVPSKKSASVTAPKDAKGKRVLPVALRNGSGSFDGDRDKGV
jgi:hypothetical protein